MEEMVASSLGILDCLLFGPHESLPIFCVLVQASTCLQGANALRIYSEGWILIGCSFSRLVMVGSPAS